jgi:hypothetical protein
MGISMRHVCSVDSGSVVRGPALNVHSQLWAIFLRFVGTWFVNITSTVRGQDMYGLSSTTLRQIGCTGSLAGQAVVGLWRDGVASSIGSVVVCSGT